MRTKNLRCLKKILTVLAVAGALFLATGSRTTFTQSGPVPQVTLNVPAEVLIGEDFTFTVKFKNASANPGDIGYGPFINLVLDAGGANLSKNNPACACDGITFVKAEMVGVVGGPIMLTPSPPSPINTTPCGTVSNTSVSHPLASSGILPLTVPPGGQLITLELPFGSFDPTQPEIVVEVTAHVSNLADAGTPLKIFARGGFRYGTDPLDNPSTDPPIVSDLTSSGGQETNSTLWAAQATVTPTVITVGKKYLGPEDEAATGPNFTSVYPLQYAITVDIANGQTVSNVTVTDCFPNNLAFQSVVSVSPTTPPPTVTPPPPGPNNPPNNCLTVTWPSLTGASGPDATVVVDFFIPEKDANGNPVLPPNCQPVQSVNDVKAEGDWTPIDSCDTSPAHVVSDVTTSDHILADKCIAIQKKVAVFQDTGAPGPTPGDVLQYTLNFQISDFKTFGKLEIRDQLSDGQQFLPNPAPTLTVTDQFGTVSGPFIPFLDLFVTGDPNSTCQGIQGTTNLVFMVSQKMTSLFPSNPRHVAGILTGGWATTPTSSVPATGQIVFYARIQDQFSFPQNHPGDRFVDKDDPLANCVTIRGEVFTNVDPPTIPSPTGVVVTDDSKTLTSIVTDVIKKTVYAVKRGGQEICGPNTSPCPAKPQVTPGDEVTFRIEKTIPSSDAENLTIQDWLPLPIFDVADPDANGTAGPPMSFSAAACGIPAPGQACLGPTNTLTVSPTFTSNIPTNSVTFNYGTFNDPTNTPRKIDLLFTLTATNDPFADGLFLTNEAQECEDNTFGVKFCQVAIAQVQIAEPDVRILKGVVASDNPNAIFSPAAPPSGTFTPPGGSCPRFSGTINSSNIGSLNLNSNVSGVDANDTVTFAIVVENLGTGPNGVFDVKIRDIFPLGPTDLPSCFVPDFSTLCVTDGTGTPIPFTTSPGGFGSVIIELTDPSLTQGALGPFHPTNGRNIAVITFDAKLIADIKSGCCDNRARLENYSNTESGPNFVAAGFGGPFEDAAQACVGPRPFAKCIQTTSEAHTTPQSASQAGTVNATIGEIVRYRLVTVIPEGTTRNFQIQDLLPPGLTYVGNPSVIFVADNPIMSPPAAFWPTSPNQALAQCPGPTFPVSALNVAGGPFTPGLGVDPIFFVASPTNPAPVFDIVNNDNDPNLEFAIIEFNAQVDNIASNQSSTNLADQFQVRFKDDAGNQFATNSGPVNVHVVEPSLTITKTVSPNPVVQGGTVTYTVTIANAGTADAFDVAFTDTLPVGLTPIAGSLSFPAGCTGTLAAPNVSVTCATIPVNGSVSIAYQAVANPGSCPATLTNQAKVTWTSLPGPKGTCPNPTGSCTPGNSGAIDGERDGSTAPNLPNKYAAAASATLTVTCPPGTIVIKKASVGGDDTFPFTASAGLPGSFTITTTSGSGTQTFSNLTTPGTYTVTELAPPAGWTFTSLTCTDPTNNTTVSSSTATIVLDPGETVTCTYTNTKSTACVDPSSLPNMVAWWPLDETSGTTANDLAGVPNNGTHVNGPTPIPGKVAGALRFDGVDDHVRVPDQAELNVGTGNFTLDAWVRTGSSDLVLLVDKRSGPTPQGYAFFLVNGRLGFQMANGVGSPSCAPTPTPGYACVNYVTSPTSPNVADGQWHHVAAVVDRADATSGVRLYVDGVQVFAGSPLTGNLDNLSDLYLGVRTPDMGGTGFFPGDLDEVELFKRALTQQEIQAIYNAGSAGKCKCATVSNEQIACNPNGTFSYTATLTNVTNAVVTGINLVPPAGVTITPSSITTSLSPGQSVTGTVTIGGPNAQPGSTVCVDIVLTTQGVVTCQTKHCVTLPTCPGPGPCAQAPAGMVSWWPLDDAVGQSTVQDLVGGNNGTTKDSTGTPLNISLGAGPQVVSQLPAPNILGGTLTPVVVDPSTSPLRGALFFNRSFTEVPHHSSLNIGSNGITITFWAFASPIPIARTPLLEKFDVSSTNGYSLYLEVNSPTTYALKMNLNGTILTGPSVPQGLSPSDWRFIAARVSATGTVTLAVCDLGGSCSTTTATVSSFVTTNTSPLWFGRSAVAYPGAVVAALALALDEIEIFKRALTQAELQSIYDAERQGRRKCSCVPPPPDMVAWYPLDEQNGATTVSDIASPPASTVSDTGTPKPGPVGSSGPNPVPGKVGAGALYFFGPFVEVPPSADLTFTGDFSIDAWIRVVECGMSGGGVLAPIVDKWDPTTQTGFSLFVDQPSPSTGFLKLQLNNMLFTSTGSLPTGANPLANTGPWVHVAVTVDRTSGVGTFYINGTPAGTFTVPAGSITNALTMLIGEIRVPGGRCELAIDELELFNRVLTPQEVQDIFNAGSAGKCRPQPGQTGQICVTKFEDLDGDGVQDPNEPLLPNWVFNVTDPSNNPVGTITTTPPGTPPACLTVPAPGTYTVTETVQSGWTPTAPASGSQTVTVQPGQTLNLSFGNAQCIPAPSGMTAWWPLDETSGTTVTDIVNGFNGTTQPGPIGGSTGPGPTPTLPSSFPPGMVGSSLFFGGTRHIRVPHNPNLDPGTGSFAVDFWFIWGGGSGPIIQKMLPTGEGWGVFVVQTGPSTAYVEVRWKFASGISMPSLSLPVTMNQWYHVFAEIERNTVAPALSVLAVNGTLFTNTGISVATTETIATTADLLIGGDGVTPGARIAVDEVELFTRSLTVQEVLAIFNAGKAGKCKDLSRLCVRKFSDLDGDGIQDPNEPLLPGWVFNVTDQNNNPVGTITTTPPGTPPACLTAAAPGTYTVTEQVQSGWMPTTPNPQTVTVQPGQTVNVTFGNQGKAEICIFKFSDLDGDGKQGPNEPPLAGWQFTVSPAPLPPTTSPVTTGPQGSICFGVAAPGTYTITEQVQSGWTVTTPNPQTVTVTPGQLVNVFFGNRPQPGEICVVKFEDLDGDGVRDTNEPLLAGWQFTVTDASNTPVGTITTGQTQPTCLKSVAPGTYTVTETVQSGWTVTTPNPQTVTVAPATSSVVEFGNKRVTYQICGIKWNDLDGDGVKDPNEPGLPGWTINMVFQTPGGPLDVQTTTDANGQYCFTGLAPGTYTISETLQSGWIQTFPPSPGTYTVTVPPSAMNINFGNKQGVCDREITKTIMPNPAQSGQQVTITLTVTNVGTAACPAVPGVVLADPQPTGMTFQPPVSVTGSGAAGWNCFISSPSGAWPGGVQCTATNPLPPGTGVTITFAATVTGTPGSQIQNCAEVTNVGDANQANNKSCVTLQVTGCVTPPANMTAWWPLDETSGTTAADIAGFPNNGTHVNGPTPTPGKVGGALRFDGVDDHVSVLDHAELDVGTGNFTLDAWVRTQASSGVVVLVDKRSGPTPLGYSLFLANGRLGFQMASGAGSPSCAPTPTPGVACVNYVASAPSVADGQWHHVAAVVDRADTTSGVRLYVDGVQVFAGSPLTGNLDNTSDLYLGMRTPAQNGGGFLRGDLDEVELIKRALTQQEIQAIFNAGSAGKCKGCIEGMKWNDANGNGVINPGEAGLSGWTIQLTGPVNQTTTTGAGGTYRFCGLPPGTYTVAEVLQPLWVQTFPPTPGTHTVNLAANQVVTGRNFGNRRVIIFPDFTPTNLVVIPPGIPGGNVALGSQVLVRFDIVNQGTGEAGPARHEIRLIAGGGPVAEVNVLLATVMTGPLAAGGSQSFNQLVTIPRDVPTGPALIRVIADAPNGISESEEGNNVAEFRIVLIRPGP
jgi:uncharacterized repeat protein (TIGR01451 family)